MNKPVHSEENLPPYPQTSIQQDADNSTLAGGMQAVIGDDNIQIQGHGNTITQTKILQISVDEIKTRQFIQSSPYKGLKKFELEDKDLFFGRDQFITQLVKKLEHRNLILLLGASGSGKSSVVRAGLIPWLLRKWGSHFVHLTFTPDQDPFESLYASLLSKFPQKEAQMAREAKADTVTQVVTKLKRSESFWFIFIDQFEELFTTTVPEKRDKFINGLVKLSQTKNNFVKIIGTMRADFLDKLSPYPQLIKTTDDSRPLIAEMQPDELRLAIEQPAAHHGVVFETGLVEEIIKNVQGQAGYLPLLQYTLNLLWETEVQTGGIYDRTLNISTYRELGGVRGALQQHTDGIYDKLSETEKLAAKRIFLKLVGITGNSESNTEWQPVLKRALRSEFSDKLEQTLLVKLIDENLLVSDHQPQSQESTVEIAHEMLLTAWTTLNDWIKENRQAIALSTVHVQSYEMVSYSSDGKILAAASENKYGNLTVKLWSLESGKVLSTLRNYQASGLSGLITKDISISPDNKVLAVASGNNTIKLWNVTTGSEIHTLQGHDREVISVSFSPDSKVLASGPEVGDIKLWNVETGSEIRTLQGYTRPVFSISFSPDGKVLAAASGDRTIKLWDVKTGSEIFTLNNDKAVYSVSFSPNGEFLISVSDDSTVKLWSMKSETELSTLQGDQGRITSASFSPDGKFLAVGNRNSTVKLLDIQLDSLMDYSCDWLYNYELSMTSMAPHYNPIERKSLKKEDKNLCEHIGTREDRETWRLNE